MASAPMALVSRVGRRGAALLFFTVLDFAYGGSLLTMPRPYTPFYAWMAHLAPLAVWAAVWLLVGAACAWYAFRLYDSLGFTAAVALKVGWGLVSLLGWVAGSVTRGWVSSMIWLAFAAFVGLIAGGIPPAPARTDRRRRWIQ